mmetsp:Transcript_10283/g.26095  ORF Transcript_10283/g.26095 Transcript_10283/m.26095 type:complete len:386 (-) Transcript_10283:2443-3600(-)
MGMREGGSTCSDLGSSWYGGVLRGFSVGSASRHVLNHARDPPIAPPFTTFESKINVHDLGKLTKVRSHPAAALQQRAKMLGAREGGDHPTDAYARPRAPDPAFETHTFVGYASSRTIPLGSGSRGDTAMRVDMSITGDDAGGAKYVVKVHTQDEEDPLQGQSQGQGQGRRMRTRTQSHQGKVKSDAGGQSGEAQGLRIACFSGSDPSSAWSRCILGTRCLAFMSLSGVEAFGLADPVVMSALFMAHQDDIQGVRDNEGAGAGAGLGGGLWACVARACLDVRKHEDSHRPSLRSSGAPGETGEAFGDARKRRRPGLVSERLGGRKRHHRKDAAPGAAATAAPSHVDFPTFRDKRPDEKRKKMKLSDLMAKKISLAWKPGPVRPTLD